MTTWKFKTGDFAIHLGSGYPDDMQVAALDQVHGAAVYERVAANANQSLTADGHWTRSTMQWVGVRTADCLPVLIGIPGVAVAAIHAGWRGVHARIVNELYRQWAQAGFDLAAAQWFLGPHIHPCSFEVQRDVADAFADRAFAADIVLQHSDGTISVDLLAVLQFDLLAESFARPQVIRSLVGDTVRDTSLPSYRRQGAAAGRLYSSIERLH